MSYRDRLFTSREAYSLNDKNNELFFHAVKENFEFQYNNCSDYRRIMDKLGFNPSMLTCYKDIEKIPPIPTLYFKTHHMLTMKKSRIIISATSSGTSRGNDKSFVGLNFKSCIRGVKMLKGVYGKRPVLSLRPSRFIVFGYEYNRHVQMAMAKSTYGSTFFAPALSKDYALRYTKEGYKLDLQNIKNKLIKYSKKKAPVRTVGFPAYTYFLLKQMKDEGIILKLPKGSLLTIGGGWKQFYAQKVDKNDFYKLVYEVLGIPEDHVIEFFSAVEHPIVYTDCSCHHFHIPKYSRVIIRDPKTLQPAGYNKVGLINLVTPMVDATPLVSVMTDDLGILHSDKCSCGLSTPYLEIIGRVGAKGVITCANGANEYLKGEK